MAKKKPNNTPKIETRAPVVVVMGHIDHGKSSLLDYIRSENTTDAEAGGITQAISAYEVEREHNGEKKNITFIDTPGHEAFQAMRERGAQIGDVAILVVAADDGVNAQTIEAFKAIKESDLPYIVALNKIDLPGADVNKAISSLIENEVYLEGYGGDVPYNAISAKTGEGVGELLDTIHLVADLEELTADRNAPASGFVLEANIDSRAGIAATLIIKDGSIKSGQAVVAGKSFAPVRVLRDFQGKTIKGASFSSPVELVGFDELPAVGDSFTTHNNKKEALTVIENISDAEVSELVAETKAEIVIPLVIKADVAGSIEAVKYEIAKLDQDRAKYKILSTGMGAVNEGDVRLAGSQKNGVIIGFNTTVDANAKDLAERQEVLINSYEIIYELIEWLDEILKLRTPKRTVEKTVGKAKILKTFNRSKAKQIIGGRVEEGELQVKARVNILRRDEIIGQGVLYGLQQSRTETERVEAGNEFGCSLETKLEVVPGDYIEAFVAVEE